MFIEILEYLGIVVVIVAFYFSYKRFKNGEFSKEYQEQEEQKEPKTKFQKWWKQSYLREVYVVRAGQRDTSTVFLKIAILISFLLIIGSTYDIILEKLYPLPAFEKLKRYDGVVLKYNYNKKSDNILVIKLKDGTVKNIHANMSGKNLKDKLTNQKLTIYVQKYAGIIDLGEFEKMVWLEKENQPFEMFYKNYNLKYQKHTQEGMIKVYLSHIIFSFKLIILFLTLLWFINRNPIKQINQTTNKKD